MTQHYGFLGGTEMHTYYGDILEKIPMEPIWWGENAVPRYCQFEPACMANIYAREAVLLWISCQFAPLKYFKVALSRPEKEATLAAEIREKTIRYGDPPNTPDCNDPSSNSIAIQVFEYWRRNEEQYVRDGTVIDPSYFAWKRDPALEIDVTGPGDEFYRDGAC